MAGIRKSAGLVERDYWINGADLRENDLEESPHIDVFEADLSSEPDVQSIGSLHNSPPPEAHNFVTLDMFSKAMEEMKNFFGSMLQAPAMGFITSSPQNRDQEDLPLQEIPNKDSESAAWKEPLPIGLSSEKSEGAIGSLTFEAFGCKLKVDANNRPLLPLQEDILSILNRGNDLNSSSTLVPVYKEKAYFMTFSSPEWKTFFLVKELKISNITVDDKDIKLIPIPKTDVSEELSLRKRIFKLIQCTTQLKPCITLSADLSSDFDVALLTSYNNMLNILEEEVFALFKCRLRLREKVLVNMPSSLAKTKLIGSPMNNGLFLFDSSLLQLTVSQMIEKRVQVVFPKTFQGPQNTQKWSKGKPHRKDTKPYSDAQKQENPGPSSSEQKPANFKAKPSYKKKGGRGDDKSSKKPQ
jgi:hypothetical protein